VQDSGSGINIENRQKIFAAFAQADGSFSRAHSGLGLGLAMCRQFVKLMNGDLTLVSEKNSGSRFDFIVDLDVIDNVKKTAEPVLKDISTLSKEYPHILIVEDNVTNQIILKHILESYGFTVLTADNGLEALQLLETTDVDLIFMDCQMPVMNGFDATQCIRSGYEGKLTMYQAVPIIAVTANVLSGDRERCIESGMNDYLKKPVKKLQIKEKIQQWLTS
jgi:CheY-like chemotaxis protein